LYNGSISGLSLDGSLFFYENPLESRGRHNRWKWHRCPCCPPNIGRMVASIGSYFYGLADDALAVHLYGDSTARFEISGKPVSLVQTSNYPWDGAVSIRVEPQAPVAFTLHLRVPAWCRKAALKVNGKAMALDAASSDGYAAIQREWQKGDHVELDLDMSISRLFANPEVRQDIGRVALARGPLIYCVEATDNPGQLHRISLPRTAEIEAHHEPNLLGGIVTLSATGRREASEDWRNGLYRAEPPATEEARVKAVPYYAWDNRDPGEMLVWLREG
ncbi:glycoside hydrolase family 127 protein, partial [Mesorhizobium sp. M4B.F.Ca.ET.019.03.1.1]